MHRRDTANWRHGGLLLDTVTIMMRTAVVILLSLLVATHSIAVNALNEQVLASSPPASSEPTSKEGDPFSRPAGIMILAQGRSGSTLLGELFRQNKEVLYWYEPCRSPHAGSSLVDEECQDLVRRLTSCRFTLEDSVWIAEDHTSVKNGSPALANLLDGLGKDDLDRAHKSLLITCEKSRAAIVKVVRLFEGLAHTADDLSEPRILHLVRDPRAVVRSELKNFKHVYDDDDVDGVSKAHDAGQRICNTYRLQLDSTSSLDDTRYLRVKFEDIATSPNLALELIYCWSGLRPVPHAVSSWVQKNTQLPDCNAVAVAYDEGGSTSGGDISGRSTLTGSRTISNKKGHSGKNGRGEGVDGKVGSGSSGGGNTDGGGTKGSHNGGKNSEGGQGRHLTLEGALESEITPTQAPNTVGAAERAESKHTTGSERNVGIIASHSSRRYASEYFTARRMDTAVGQGGGIDESPCNENSKQSETNPYGTRRHSAAMAGLWRSQMREEDAAAVWEMCEDSGVMEDLLYLP